MVDNQTVNKTYTHLKKRKKKEQRKEKSSVQEQ
jgi:hypothetical protein